MAGRSLVGLKETMTDDRTKTPEIRRLAHSRKNSAKVEQNLSQVERTQGAAKAWELPELLERGQVTLADLKRERT